MHTQPSLVQICTDEQALDPKTLSLLQLYVNKDDGQLHGKTEGGDSVAMAVKLANYKGETTDGIPKELFLNSIVKSVPDRLKQPLNTSTFYSFFVIAIRNGVTYATGLEQLQFLVKNVNGVTTIVTSNSPINLNVGEPESNAWTAGVTLSDDEIVFTVTGENGKIIEWNATPVKLANVSF